MCSYDLLKPFQGQLHKFPISLYLVAIAIATTHFCWDLLVPWEFISQLTRTGIMVVKLVFCATVTKSIYNLLLLCRYVK